MNGLFPPTLDKEMIAAMKAAGFKTLNLSLGATCREQLSRFRRPDVRDAFDNCLELAEKYGLDAVGYVICGAPDQEAEKSLEDLIYFASRRVLAGLSVFYPAPGSNDYETARSLKILPEESSLFRSSVIPLSHKTSRLQSVTLMRLSRIINFMKSIIDRGHQLPPPAFITENQISSAMDRQSVGEYLLAGFLADGIIRGISPQRHIYRHIVDDTLTTEFIAYLKTRTVRGSGRF
jgi:radical SAM superfamily enzyme YgiQ (UPF0313 family)